MKLTLKRVALKEGYTIGHLYINDEYFCDTLEDKVRDINKNGIFDAGEVKIHGETTIPYGSYKILMNITSSKFSKYAQYRFCKGRLPRLLNVPDFEGVLIHIGNYPKDTEGCILVGQNKIKGQLVNSTAVFHELWIKMNTASQNGEDLVITIV